MKELRIFNTYNQITKEFDIVSMNKQEIKQLDKNEQYLVLFPKTKKEFVNKHKSTRQPTTREMILETRKMLLETRQILVDFIKEVRTQFKIHGWIK